jgi:hypothetical protein
VVAIATACASRLDLNMQDVGTGRSQTGGAQKEQEYDRRPNQMPGHHLSFN